MKRWSYATLNQSWYFDTKKNEWVLKVWSRIGDQDKKYQRANSSEFMTDWIQRVLIEMGQEGWELVAIESFPRIVSDGNTSKAASADRIYWFKREIL